MGISLYFQKDDGFGLVANNDVEPGFLLEMKGFIDNEFERTMLRFNDEGDWDEIYEINVDGKQDGIKKCHYLSTSKVCIQKDFRNTIKASIKSQLANKPI